ncbi:MAG: ferrochelatase [Austwickia sp.]|nr:ferrochelatase [Actinomycetota bacterium]MCB1254589.1 ferrochelatase [Austwickia sp.]MCO5309258.1 ferrochelatase [Austwickia sp.]
MATIPTDALAPYDAVLVHSFGGPEAPDEVMPFLERVTAGRGIPANRLAEVAEHYYDRGGASPINDETRAVCRALTDELTRREVFRPVAWGSRFAQPFTAQTLAEMAEQGHRRVVVVPTSAYPSYSGCRAYREDLASAVAEAGVADRLVIDRLRPYALHPGFSATTVRLVTDGVRRLLATSGLPAAAVHVLYVTHSIPVAQDDASGPPPGGHYRRWHEGLATAVTAEVAATLGAEFASDLVYCSRSGPPGQPWLEPDVSAAMAALAQDGVRGVVLAPIGFTSDHMEVVYDLDEVAAATARRLGLAFCRVPTVRADPEFVSGLVDLLLERAAEARGEQPRRPSWPKLGDPLPSVCAAGCCPNPRGARPALCGQDPSETR